MSDEIVLRHVTGPEQLEDVRQLFLEYADTLDIDLCFQNFDEEVKSLPGKYSPPDGELIIALVDGKCAGCIAVRKISERICEMKRLYVRDKYRGLGTGKKLVSEIIETAKNHGYEFMRLDTLPSMKSAQNMYTAFGFYDIEPYVYNPIEGVRYMELKLDI